MYFSYKILSDIEKTQFTYYKTILVYSTNTGFTKTLPKLSLFLNKGDVVITLTSNVIMYLFLQHWLAITAPTQLLSHPYS